MSRPPDISQPQDVPAGPLAWLRQWLVTLRLWVQTRDPQNTTVGDPLDKFPDRRELVAVGVYVRKPGGGFSAGIGGGGGGGGTGIINPPGPGGEYTPDLTPPPTPTGLTADGVISNFLLGWDAPTYTQGRGHARTLIYGAVWPEGAAPRVFADAQLIDSAGGPVTIHSLPANPGTRMAFWIRWQTVDGVLSVSPAGGTNGVVATTGQDPAALLAILTGQITQSQLFSSLGARIDLIDGSAGTPGTVNFRVASAQAAAISYTNEYAYAKDDGEALASTVTTIGVRQGRVKNYRVQARGFTTAYGESSFRAEDGSLLYGAARSYNLVVLNGTTGDVISFQTYDVHNNGELSGGRNAATLAADLNALTSDKVVVIYTFDEPLELRDTGGLPAALYRCGASRTVFIDSMRRHSAYILVGIPDIGEGQGVERLAGTTNYANNASIDYQLQLVNGRPVALGGNPLSAAVQQETIARINADNSLYAQWTVKLDINGYVSGFGLASTAPGGVGSPAVPTSSFIVRADSFAVASPSGPGISPTVPFIVRTTTSSEGGNSVPPGVYMDAAYIVNLTVLYARIQTLVAGSITAASISAAQLTAGDGTIGGNLRSTNWNPGISGWQIQPNGYAEFRNAVIGGFVIGASFIQSSNWVSGSAGLRMQASGNAEFNDVTLRGNLIGGGSFNGALAGATGTFAGALSAASGTFNGTVQVGTAANSGTTMSGTGAVLNASGAFALGTPTRNIAFNGTDAPRLNGQWVTDANLNLVPFTVSISPASGGIAQLWTDGGTPNIGWSSGTVTATPSGGTAPYTYRWTLVIDIQSGDSNIIMNDPGISSTTSFSGYVRSFGGIVTAVAICEVKDANGRVATGYYNAAVQETT